MKDVHYRIQEWPKISNSSNYRLKRLGPLNEKSIKLLINDDNIEPFKTPICHPVPGLNLINGSHIKRSASELTGVLMRKTAKYFKSKKLITSLIYTGLNEHFKNSNIQFYHHDDDYDLIIYQANNNSDDSKYIISKLAKIMETIIKHENIRFQIQFMLFNYPGTIPLDKITNDAINLMVPACHHNDFGSIIKFI